MQFQLVSVHQFALDVVMFQHLSMGLASKSHIARVPSTPGNPSGPHTHFTWRNQLLRCMVLL